MISNAMRAQNSRTKSAMQTPMAVLRTVASSMLKSYVAAVLVAAAVALVADEEMYVVFDMIFIAIPPSTVCIRLSYRRVWE